MNSEQSQPKRALVLSGGGGRGAYHVGVLQFLEEHDWFPDIIVGTSIGAVNGAALASGHNAHSLKALWRRLRTRDVQKLDLDLGERFFIGDSLFDTNPLRKTLIEDGWLDFAKINAPDPKISLRITATQVNTGDLFVFCNTPGIRQGRKDRRVDITMEHIISSCSIPLIYPSTKVDQETFWDGAVVANTPLGAAIDAGADEIIVVIMSPLRSSGATQGLPSDLLASITVLLDWTLLSSFNAELRSFNLINEKIELENRLSQYETVSTTTNKRQVAPPMIIAPSTFLPLKQIITYDKEAHESLFELGYKDAKKEWGKYRQVEGE